VNVTVMPAARSTWVAPSFGVVDATAGGARSASMPGVSGRASLWQLVPAGALSSRQVWSGFEQV
jgi:hypothetical protein